MDRLTTVVDPQGMMFSVPSGPRLVIIPADWGKKHGHRASSLSVISASDSSLTSMPLAA